MIKNTLLFFLALSIGVDMSLAQDFSGKFTMPTEAGLAILTWKKGGPQQYSGTLSSAGYEVALEGNVTGGVLEGLINDGSGLVVFQAQFQQEILMLTFSETDGFGNPIPGASQVLYFEKSQDIEQENIANNAKGVTINGVALTNAQTTELESTYGVTPLPGNYWYDSVSGLYGVVGYQAFGFMYPGHDFGQLKRNASRGDSGVIVNGRELSQTEWLIWSYMLGSVIQMGSYWLDAQGNAGYEGNPQPIVNLYMAAQQNGYNGRGGSGDNFWSSRFSAGNYDSGNQRGYVSVPGHGPVGYGF